MNVTYDPTSNTYIINGRKFGSYLAAKSYIDMLHHLTAIQGTNDNAITQAGQSK